MAHAAKYASIVAEADAKNYVSGLIDRQVYRATRDGTTPNTAADGDSEARAAFEALLSLATQRAVFINNVRDRRFWPRVRTLIGIPPFAFLRPEDDDVLNAAGIARNRRHMSGQSPMLSSAEIGTGHFEDASMRRYKVVGDDQLFSTEIPVRRVRHAKRIVLDVRVAAALSVRERASIVKRRDPEGVKMLLYPRVGETLTLQTHSDFGISDTLSVVVRTVQSKGPKSPVCRVYCVVG